MNLNFIFKGSKFPTLTTNSNHVHLPRKYIINKEATILFWNDGTKTIIKRKNDDEYNKILGFLWAYFQKTSGLSKTKANEYIKNLLDEEEIQKINK